MDLRNLPDAESVETTIEKAYALIAYKQENPDRFRVGYDSDENRAWFDTLQRLRLIALDGISLAAVLRARAKIAADKMIEE